MEIEDKKRFVELIVQISQMFVADIAPADIENYWRFLRPYSWTDVERAIVNYYRSQKGHRFMPKPAELIAALEDNAQKHAQQAWVKVMKAIRQLGGDKTVVFDDPLIHAVIYDMGGWVRLCEMRIQDESFKLREFEKRYVNYWHKLPSQYPRQLMGRMSSDNTSAMPVVVGDEKKAIAVFKWGQDMEKLPPYKILSLERLKTLVTEETES